LSVQAGGLSYIFMRPTHYHISTAIYVCLLGTVLGTAALLSAGMDGDGLPRAG
jgi:hypothetical protein